MALYVRADASPDIGLGHVMRCLALAEAASERGVDTCFVGAIATPVIERLEAEGHRVIAGKEDKWLQEVRGADVVVFDGYAFTPADHVAARDRAARVAAVDDFGEGRYDVDVVVHPNLAPAPSFEVRPSTRVLVGPTYALVRREFRTRRRLRHSGKRLLVTLGGSDVAGIAAQIVRWADRHAFGWVVRLLVGPTAPKVDVPPHVDVVRGPADVGAVFDDSDVAIAAAGSTTWDLCCMGIPALLVQVADNQRHVAAPVAECGAGIFLGAVPLGKESVHTGLDELQDGEVRAAISRAAMELVDGEGASRVLDVLFG